MTNWSTISEAIKRLNVLESNLTDPDITTSHTKKEILKITRQKDKLLKSFAGIRKLNSKPDLMIVVDTNKEKIAIQEAYKLSIPVVAILDTNSNPDNIEYPVPGNDDAMRSIRIYLDLFSSSALAGIEASLIESGVDLGASDKNVLNSKEVIKQTIKSNKQKVTPHTQNIDSTKKIEFESALQDGKESIDD